MYTSNPFTTVAFRPLATRILPLLSLLAVTGLTGCHLASDGPNLDGVRLYQQGQYPSALQRFQQAVAANPDNADAYYNMAATTHRLGSLRQDGEKLAVAETLYNQCLDVDADHTDCYRGLAVLLNETGRSDRAFTLMKNWAVRSPQSPEPRIELARLYEEFGDTETAELHLQQALQIDQQNPRAWAALGRMREQAGDYVQALANYQRSFQLNTFQPAVAERIASLNVAVNSSHSGPAGGNTRTVVSTTPVQR